MMSKMKNWLVEIIKKNKVVYQLLTKCNLFLFHRDKREHLKRTPNGIHPDKTFFWINYENRGAGLFGLVDVVIGACEYAEEHGWIPVVYFGEDDVQYKLQNEKTNVWEVFFKQVTPFSIEEVKRSRNIVYMGYDTKAKRCIRSATMDTADGIIKRNAYLHKRLQLSEEAEKRLREERERIDVEHAVGVFVRGTDYVALRPSKHLIQPTVEQVIDKVNEYLEKNPDTSVIYLVTEDAKIYQKMYEVYGDKLQMTGKHFIEKYDGNGLIANYIQDSNEQGMEYLVRIFMLAECSALIGGPAAGSSFAILLNGNKYHEKTIFDLGIYP